MSSNIRFHVKLVKWIKVSLYVKIEIYLFGFRL